MKSKPAQHPDLPGMPAFAPRVHIPAICIPQPGGAVLVKPGKPQIIADEIRVAEFAKHTGLSISRVETLCAEGLIASRRLTKKPKSPYVIPRTEVDHWLNIRRIETR